MSSSRHPYLLRSLHKSAQRLILLAACAAAGSETKASTAQRVAAVYGERLFDRVLVPPNDYERILSYVSRRALVREYAERAKLKGSPTVNAIRERLVAGDRLVLRQDWLLSDPTLDVCTGREQRESLARTVSVCQELNLLHPSTCTLQSYGALLRTLATDEGLFLGLEGEGPNSFRRNVPYSLAAFFQIARSDWRVLSPLLGAVSVAKATTFSEVCTGSDEIIRKVAASVPRNVTTHQLHDWLNRQLGTAKRLKARTEAGASARSGSSIQTLYRPLEDMFLSRLEILADIGALEKPESCWRYSYRRVASTQELLLVLAAGDDGLETGYFGAMATLHARVARPLGEPMAILAHLRAAHSRFHARNGYAPILECVVYANARSWSADQQDWVFVELGPAVQALRTLAGAVAPPVRLMADRFRRPFTFAITGSAE